MISVILYIIFSNINTTIDTLPYLTLPYLTLPYLTLPYLTLPYLTSLPYLTLPYLTLPYLALPYLTLPYLTGHNRQVVQIFSLSQHERAQHSQHQEVVCFGGVGVKSTL